MFHHWQETHANCRIDTVPAAGLRSCQSVRLVLIRAQDNVPQRNRSPRDVCAVVKKKRGDVPLQKFPIEKFVFHAELEFYLCVIVIRQVV
jgi:hypothetical protein